ncbi:MAG: hypothetical protein Q7K57_22420, partial [Burkholderiaceae bacterium]|nr:hypothetical protein [Burkholderiaceae bacterium]
MKFHYLKITQPLLQMATGYSDGMDVSTYTATAFETYVITNAQGLAATASLCQSGGLLQPLNRRPH